MWSFFKRIRSKATEEMWRHHFPHYKSKAAFCWQWKSEFWSNLPPNLMQPFPLPMMLHINLIKTGQLASEIFKFKSVKFSHSGASNSKMSGLIWPKIELNQAFMPVLAISNFDDDSIKNERASMETPFSHYKAMHVLVTCKYKKDWIKSNREKVETPFSPL